MRCLGAFLVVAVCCAGQTLPFPSKAEWTANPGVIWQSQKKYPGTVNVVMYLRACTRDGSSKVQNPLSTTKTYRITVTGAGVSASAPLVGDCTLTTVLTIDASTQPGNQFMVVTDQSDPAKPSVEGAAVLALMDSTAGPTPSTPEVDVLWDVISQHVCSDSFGNHVPKYLYCIEVKIGNNSGHSLQLAGVGFKISNPFAGRTGIPTNATLVSPNTAYQTTRSVLQAGGGTTTRNLIYKSVQAIGLIMASFTPFFSNSSNKAKWSTGAAIVSGAFVQAIDMIAPDLTIRELNNLDDQAFRDGKLIPNNTQIRMIVFVDKELIAGSLEEKCTALLTFNNLPPSSSDLKKCKGSNDPTIIKVLLGDLVVVGDMVDYLQRMVVDSSVTSQEANPGPSVQDSSWDATANVITLSGTGLKGVHTITVDGTAIDQGQIKNQSATQIQFTPPTQMTPKASHQVQIQAPNGSQTVSVKAP
jgi:hypothetical protein